MAPPPRQPLLGGGSLVFATCFGTGGVQMGSGLRGGSTPVSGGMWSQGRQQGAALLAACFLGEEKAFSTSKFTVKQRNCHGSYGSRAC